MVVDTAYGDIKRDKPKDAEFHEAVRNVQWSTAKKASGESRIDATYAITGYACACPDTTAPTRPAVVLDPFAGTGTVPAVAHLLGRHGVGTDLSRDYLRLAEWRCSSDQRLRSKVIRRSVVQPELDLFGSA